MLLCKIPSFIYECVIDSKNKMYSINFIQKFRYCLILINLIIDKINPKKKYKTRILQWQ